VVEGILRFIFHAAESSNPKTRALRYGYLRLVDKCTYEYRRGRELLMAFVDAERGQRFGILLQSASHFESCISTMKRAVSYLDALRRDKDGPSISKNVAVLRNQDRIRRVRDAIEHTDEDILKGTLSPGDAHVLLVKDDELELAGEKIRYDELAKWIEELHDEAHKIAGHGAASPGAA
jgi:hypothetical protein